MGESPTLLGVPEHHLLGENLPQGLVVALAVLGLAIAGASVWLAQDMPAQHLPKPTPTSPMVVGNGVAVAMLANSLKVPESASSAAVLPVSQAETPKISKPSCPAMVSVFFPVGAAVPDGKRDTAGLDRLVDWAKSSPNAKVAIEGHADVVGLDQANLLLSYERAKAVAAILSKAGLSPQQVQIAATGSHSLVDGLPGDAQANRRATVHINDPDGCQTATK